MLVEEAKWFGHNIFSMEPDAVFPLCNVGSSSEHYRKEFQPWTDEHIFKPARERQRSVVHLDVKSAPGVDIVGDLTDKRFLTELSSMRFASVLCSNLLEHVPNPGEVCEALISVVRPGGYLFISCPFRMPYHPDPIDTMFRPSVDGLSALFPGTRMYFGETVSSGTYASYISRWSLFRQTARIFLPFYKPREWPSILGHVPWYFTRYLATCVVLRKAEDPSIIN